MRVLRVLSCEIRFIDVDHKSDAWSSVTTAQFIAEKWQDSDDPWAALRAVGEDELSQFQLQIRANRHGAVKALLARARELAVENSEDSEEFLFNHSKRIRLCQEVGAKLRRAPCVLYRWLKDWWRRGMCRNACLPDVETMVGKGKVRDIPASACDSTGWPLDPNRYQSIGRPPGIRGIRGIRMTEPIRCSILTTGKQIYKDHPNFSVRDAYLLWKEQCGLPPERTPSPFNFTDVFESDPEIKTLISQRHLVGRKPKGRPPIRESTSTRVPGPGFRYQMDATPTPIRILDQATGQVGPCATLYWAIDTYVKGIAGYEISGESERALGAQIAYYNATQPKDTHCAKYDKKIDRSQWPMWGTAEEVAYDRRLIGPAFDLLLEVFGTDIDNTPAYSPQLRADVEAAFGSFLRKALTKLDAYIPPRAGRKLDGGTFPPLTMYELHRLVIHFVLEYNSRELDRLPTPSDVTNNVLNTPTARWNGEIDRLKGTRTIISEEDALLAFTVCGKADIHRRGIEHTDGLLYRFPSLELESFQHKLGERSKRISIRYIEAHTHCIFVQYRILQKAGVHITSDKPHKFIRCELHPECEEWAGYSFAGYRAAIRLHNDKMRAARDLHHQAGAERLKEVISEKVHVKLQTRKDSDVPDIAAQIAQASADERLISGDAVSPATIRGAPSKAVDNEYVAVPPAQMIADRNLSALRAARANCHKHE